MCVPAKRATLCFSVPPSNGDLVQDQRGSCQDCNPVTRLGEELLRLRGTRGLSLRRLAKLLGMTAHSGLVDYERGRRIPPRDLMSAYLRVLSPRDDGLLTLYRAALDSRVTRRLSSVRPLMPATPTLDDELARQEQLLTSLAQTLENVAGQLRILASARSMSAGDKERIG